MTQVTYIEKPKSCAGGIVFLVLEMITMLLMEVCCLCSMFFVTDVTGNMTSTKVTFWIVFLVWFAGYIIMIVGANKRNTIGVLIAGFSIFLLLEWEEFISSFSSLGNTPAVNIISLSCSTFVWISLIILTCIKKAPKPLCLIPGFFGIIACFLKFYVIISHLDSLEKLSIDDGGTKLAFNVFSLTAEVLSLILTLWRPFWVFMISYWLTHPTRKVAVPVAYAPVAPQPYNLQPVQPVQQYQPVYPQAPQPGCQQYPQQGYPYGQPQQPPYPQQ